MPNSVHDVIIIGAGISGLSCAQELSSYHQINLTVLEASDRIGGRVHTIKTPDGTTLSLGAQYIHGTIGNELYNYMIAKGLVPDQHSNSNHESERNDFVTLYPKELSIYDKNDIENAYTKASEYLEEFQKQSYSLTGDEIKMHRTFGGYMVHCFERTLDAFKDDHLMYSSLKSMFLNWISSERISSNTPSVFNLDIQGFRNWIELDGISLLPATDVCENGFANVVELMAKDVNPKCIHLNSKVTTIYNIEIDNQSKMKVSCSNGKVYFADTVVVTVSLGVLKNFVKNDVFSFQLPQKKYSAIENLSYGNAVKIFFKFSVPIDDTISYFQFYPSPKTNTYAMFDKVPDDQTLERIGLSDWWVSWYVGNDCNNFEFTLDPANYLNKLIQKYSEMYTSFPSNSVIKESILVCDWSKDELFCGSYMYHRTGANGNDVLDLAAAVKFGDANLLFAGEATSVNYFSSLHGALISGRREAENIKVFYKLSTGA